MNNQAPIGIFDSGFGGLTVMKAIRQLLPHENIIYFGDTARLPYGTKSFETVTQYSIENTSFLVQQGVKAVVVACHTACSHALDTLHEKFSLPILGVTTASIEDIVHHSPSGKIGILATRGTIASGNYQTHIKKLLPSAEVTGIACQLLVNLVEEGYIDHHLTELAIQDYLRPFLNQQIDSIILGCTHFPLLQHLIQKAVGPHIQVIDPAQSCARALKELLTDKQLLNPTALSPNYRFYASDDPEKFSALGQRFLDHPIHHVEKNT